MGRSIQLDELFRLLRVSKSPQNEMLAKSVLAFLVAIPVGDSLKTPWFAFERLGEDLFRFESLSQKSLAEQIAESLDEKSFLRLPW